METEFNFNSQVCTSREQSEALMKLGLKKETADMCSVIDHVSDGGKWEDVDTIFSFTPDDWNFRQSVTPRWSLHRLIELCRIEGSGATLELVSLDQTYDKYIGQIRRMIKEGYFNKEYLCEK